MDEESEEYKQKVAQVEKLSRKLVRLARRIKAVQEADIDCEEMDKWGNLYLQVCFPSLKAHVPLLFL